MFCDLGVRWQQFSANWSAGSCLCTVQLLP